MKSRHNTFIANAIMIFLFIALFSLTYSQQILKIDSLKTGATYKFLMYNDNEFIGKITDTDSLYIKISDGKRSYRIKKEDIFSVSKKLEYNKFRVVLSAGGGTSFLYSFNENKIYDKYNPGYSLQLACLFPLDEFKGIRVDAGYSKWIKNAYTVPDYFGHPGTSSYSEQTKDYYYFKSDIAIGLISPSNKFWIYGLSGFGIQYMREGALNINYGYYLQDSVYYTKSGNTEAVTFNSALFSIGGSFGYRITNNFGVYADAQMEYISHHGFFNIFTWSSNETYFPVKIGMTYTIF